MHRFFIPTPLFQTPEIILPAEVSQQISRVLRLKTGTDILLLDDQGFEYLARLCEVQASQCTATIIEKRTASGEPATRLTLIIGLTQREKFEMILQKCTEVGVSTFVPVISSRTLIQKPRDVEDKYPRWKKIIQEAAEQSHRGHIPTLEPVIKIDDALKMMNQKDSLKIVFWEDENKTTLKNALQSCQKRDITIIIGPEGGLSVEEVAAAQRSGFMPATLGRRILRMETAAILAAGLVLYEFE